MAKQSANEGNTALSNRIDGKVASCGSSGNLITDIANDLVAGLLGDESVSIKFGVHETLGIFDADHGEPDATLVASLGESGFLEVEIVGVSLSNMLGIGAGVAVNVSW